MKKSPNISDWEQVKLYLTNKLSRRKRHQLEKWQLNDPFEMEAMEGLEEDRHSSIEDVEELRRNLRPKPARNWYRAAAIITFLMASTLTLYFVLFQYAEQDADLSKVEEKITEEGSTSRDLSMSDSISELEELKENPKAAVEIPPKVTSVEPIEEKQTISVEGVQGEKIQIQGMTENERLDLGVDKESIDDSKTDVEIEVINEEEDLNEAVQFEVERIVGEELAAVPADKSVEDASKKREAKKDGQALSRSTKKSAAIMVADSRTVKGKVIDEEGTPIPGVNILQKGSSMGALSDIDGNFSIVVPANEKVVLVFSFIGLMTEEVDVSELEYAEISLAADNAALSEVVVVGYGASSDDQKDQIEYPKPVIGRRPYKKYLNDSLRYPTNESTDKTETVKLKFWVSNSGDVSEIKVTKSPGYVYNREAIRLVREGPKWIPGKRNGITEPMEVQLKIRFKKIAE